MKKNWERGKLSDYIQDFIVPQRDKPKSFDGSIPWCRIEDIDGMFLSKSKSGKCVTREVIKAMPLRVFPRDTVIVSCSADLGRCAVVSTPLVTNQTFIGLVPKVTLSPVFLYHLMTSKADELNAAATGATIKYLSQDKFKALDILVPPISEQQRIVSLLDEAFAGIATARANAEKNLRNARAIFESHLQSVFTQRGSGWVDKALGDFCSFENGDRGANYPSKSARTASGIPFINAGHLTENGINLQGMDYIPRERFDLLGAGKIRPRDILFCLRGSLGKFASVGDLAEGAIASSLVIVRPDESVLDGFLLAYFRSPLCAEMIGQYKGGTAQPNLSAKSLSRFIAPVPSIIEQQRIVEKLGGLRDETQRLAILYTRKLAALETLKKAMLDHALTGQLGAHAA
jgi:type I restriction enzyme S subunit